MATTVDTLLIRIEADLNDVKKSLDKLDREVNKTSKGVTASFSKFGMALKAVVGAVIIREAARAGMALINLASDVEEMQSKSAVVFGAFREETVAALEAFGDEVGRSTHQLEGMASQIQDTFVPMGFARGEAAKLAVTLTKLAVDVASFNNASDTDTMAAFQSALVGNHETVRRFGVVITEATLNQELMRMGIVKGAAAATNAEKVQARLNLITAGTSDAAGDAARTSGSFANQAKALDAQLSELGVELGTILLPAATALVAIFIEATKATTAFLKSVGLLDRTPAENLAFYQASVEALTMQVDVATRAIDGINEAAMAGDVGAASVDTALLTDNLNSLTKQLDTAKIALDGYKEAERMLNRKPLDLGGDTPPVTPTAIKSGKSDTTKVQEQIAYNQQLLDLERQMNDAVAGGFENAQEDIRLQTEALDLLRQYPEANVSLIDSLAWSKVELELQSEAFKKLQEEQKKTSDVVGQLSKDISSSLADALMTGGSALDALKNVFGSFVRTMIAKAIELMFVNKVMNSIFGLAGTPNALPTFSIGGKAGGGTIQGGVPTLVGERGPELFVPNTGGKILNNMNASNAVSGGGGTTVVQNFNISAGVAQTVRAEVMSMLPAIKADTMSAIVEAKRRGGSFASAFG
jgi:hypothetical protein